jgi:predicted dehydrogenase
MKRWMDLKILVVGCGSIGKRHIRVLVSMGLKNIMAVDAVKEQLDELISEFPFVKPCSLYEEGLAQKPDAVFILTPTKMHIPMAIQAISAGCHVFIEKPLSSSMEGTEELKALAEKAGGKLMVGFCFRFHEGILKAKKLLSEGKIGRLVSIRALMGEYFPDMRPDYKTLYYARYSGAFELIHDLDLAIWFAGQPITKVEGIFGPYSDIGIEAPDTVEILLGFEDRCVATVHLDFFQSPRRRQLELIGTYGTIIVEFASWDEYTVSAFDRGTNHWETITCKTTRNDMFTAEDREFLQAVAEDRPVTCTVDEACKSQQVLERLNIPKG